MSFVYSPAIILTLSSLFIRTLMALSRTNWILLWGAIELNLLRFIPIIIQTKTNQETEGAVKYFLAQALGSALLLISRTSLWIIFTSMPNIMPLLLTTAILLKLGRVPCHFWYPSVISSISWISCLILSTWQKLAPLSILAFLLPQKNISFIIVIAGINALVGGVIGINQSQIRAIMAYSSIGHIGWMLRLLAVFKPNSSLIYFMVYTILITPLFTSLSYFNISSPKQINKIPSNRSFLHLTTIILLLSLGGLPPLTGFIPKLITIIILTQSIKITIFILVAGSVINLFFYLNIVINIIFSTPNLKQLRPVKSKITNVLTLITARLSLGLRPLIIIYAMILLYQSQRYWNPLFHSWRLSRHSRCWHKTSYPNWAKTTGSFPGKRSTLQYNCYSSRIRDNLLFSDTCIYWRLRKLASPPNTRSPRYSLSPTK